MAERSGKLRLIIKKSSDKSSDKQPAQDVISTENPTKKISTSKEEKTQAQAPIMVKIQWIEGVYLYIDEANRNIYDSSKRLIGVVISHRQIDWYTPEQVEMEVPAMLELLPE